MAAMARIAAFLGSFYHVQAAFGRCRSSVVEHSLGKGEVVSSILTGSTRISNKSKHLDARSPHSPTPQQDGFSARGTLLPGCVTDGRRSWTRRNASPLGRNVSILGVGNLSVREILFQLGQDFIVLRRQPITFGKHRRCGLFGGRSAFDRAHSHFISARGMTQHGRSPSCGAHDWPEHRPRQLLRSVDNCAFRLVSFPGDQHCISKRRDT
jgi:hypothetical protein